MFRTSSYIIILSIYLLGYLISNASDLPTQKPNHDRSFDEDFKSRYSSETYNYEGEENLEKYSYNSTNSEAAEYSNETPSANEVNNDTHTNVNTGVINWIFISILIIAVIFLAYTLMNQDGKGLFSHGKFRKIKYKTISADTIEHADIDALIKQAEDKGDFRLAIRYNYLLLLKNLTLKKFITFEEDKTDSDYILELDNQPFKNSFQYTSYLYNYIWYGEFSINQLQYSKAKSNFINLTNELR